MNIQDVLESAQVINDNKARRVLNTAPGKESGISIHELEAGVTIERLESLTVPIYQYGTQITIHGIFHDIPDNLRVCGYKSIVLNGNGSLGVRYVAIDGAKKKLLANIARYSRRNGGSWTISIDSQGCEAYRIFHSPDTANDKAKCIECYNSTPDSLYVGGKRAARLMYGGFAVIINIGAIYNAKLWELITALTGITSQAEYDALVDADNKERELNNARCRAEREAREVERNAELAEATANFKPPTTWKLFDGTITTPGIFARLAQTYTDGITLRVIQSAKRGGRLCIASKDFADLTYKPWTPYKYRAVAVKLSGWQLT